MTEQRQRDGPPASDEELVDRFLERGEEAAFRELVERYRRPLQLLALSVLGRDSEAAADEIVQEVFLTAYEKLAGLRHRGALSTWLRRLALLVGRIDGASPRPTA